MRAGFVNAALPSQGYGKSSGGNGFVENVTGHLCFLSRLQQSRQRLYLEADQPVDPQTLALSCDHSHAAMVI
jgi:hypothetical protein